MFKNFDFSWFLTTPGILTGVGCLLILISIIIFLSSMKGKKKDVEENLNTDAVIPDANPVASGGVAPIDFAKTMEPTPLDASVNQSVANNVNPNTVVNNISEMDKLQTTPVEPSVAPINMEPQINPVPVAPVSVEPQIQPAPVEPCVAPINIEPQINPVPVAPVSVEPQIQPAPVEPSVAPINIEPQINSVPVAPVSVEPQIQPASVEPSVAPINIEPQINPVPVAPVSVEPQIQPAPVEPSVAPINIEPQINPVPVAPVSVEPQIQPTQSIQQPLGYGSINPTVNQSSELKRPDDIEAL